MLPAEWGGDRCTDTLYIECVRVVSGRSQRKISRDEEFEGGGYDFKYGEQAASLGKVISGQRLKGKEKIMCPPGDGRKRVLTHFKALAWF